MPVTCSLTVSSCWCLTSSASLVWLYNVISSYILPSLLRCEIQRLSESEMIALGLMGCDRFSYVFWTHVNSQHPQILCQWIPQYSWNKIPFGIFFIFNLISDSFHCCLLLLRILNLFRLEEMPGGCLIQLRPCPVKCWISPRVKMLQAPWAIFFQFFTALTVMIFLTEFPFLQLVSIDSCYLLCTSKKNLAPFSL